LIDFPQDSDFYINNIRDFVPSKIFDAHVHLYNTKHMNNHDLPNINTPQNVGINFFEQIMDQFLPGREIQANCFPFPRKTLDLDLANKYIAEEVRGKPGFFHQMLISPQTSVRQIQTMVDIYGFRGLKCYHLFSKRKITQNSLIQEYLTEEQVEFANTEKMTITLHIVKPKSLADPENLEVINRFAKEYPNMIIILAHAGRGFNSWNTINGIDSLQRHENIFFDTSAITESGAFQAIINSFGHQRLLYGSDFPVSHILGRCIRIADEFIWLTAKTLQDFSKQNNINGVVPTLVGYESIMALKEAAVLMNLSVNDIEDIFFNNAKNIQAFQ
tara:strand:+ start:4891 stop:5880 length:990 start_codon:yes stop_codon:yes gene_type:complete